MNLKFNKKYVTAAVYAFAVIACSILFYMLVKEFGMFIGWLWRLFGVLAPFFYGFCIAYAVNPLVMAVESVLKRADKKGCIKKAYRGISIVIAFFILILAVVLFGVVVGPQIKQGLATLYHKLQNRTPEVIGTIEDFLVSNEHAVDLRQQLDNYKTIITDAIINISRFSVISVWNSIKNITGILYNLVIGTVVAVYMLSGKEYFIRNIRKVLFAFFSKSKASTIINISTKANKIFSDYIYGKIIDSLIVGVLCAVGMFFLRLPFAPLIGLIVGGTNIIPYFGAWIGAGVGALFILLINPMQAVIFLVFVFLLQQLDANFITPKILGESTGMSAFWVMFSIILGGGFFGVAGLFAGVPVFALIYAIAVSFVEERYKKKMSLSKTTE